MTEALAIKKLTQITRKHFDESEAAVFISGRSRAAAGLYDAILIIRTTHKDIETSEKFTRELMGVFVKENSEIHFERSYLEIIGEKAMRVESFELTAQFELWS